MYFTGKKLFLEQLLIRFFMSWYTFFLGNNIINNTGSQQCLRRALSILEVGKRSSKKAMPGDCWTRVVVVVVVVAATRLLLSWCCTSKCFLFIVRQTDKKVHRHVTTVMMRKRNFQHIFLHLAVDCLSQLTYFKGNQNPEYKGSLKSAAFQIQK